MTFDERQARQLAEQSGVETDYGTLVRELADPDTYPILSRVVSHEPTEGLAPDPAAEFLFDLGMIIAGFEAIVDQGADR
jgi:hypothetical protein